MPRRKSSWDHLRPWKRHSLVLLVAGVIYIMIGISYITADMTPSRRVALQVALDWWSMGWWGAIFIFAGILSIISSRWPPISENWGYTALTGLSSGWAGFYLFPILFGESPLANISGVFSWGLIGFLWWAISGLVNPIDEEVRAYGPHHVGPDGGDTLGDPVRSH